MQISIDGFVAGSNGEGDWITFKLDEKLKKFRSELNDTVDTIISGRKMTDGFVGHWENVVKNHPDSPDYALAKFIVDTPKIVFSKTQKTISGLNTSITNEDLVEVVNKLKNEKGKDIIVYGGAGFVTSLIENNLIDEYYLIMNPVALGSGLSIFNQRTKLKVVKSTKYACGKVVHKFIPAK